MNNTFLDIINEVYYILRDENKERYNIERVKSLINESEKEYLKLTDYKAEKVTTLTTVADQQEYDLPSDCYIVLSVFYDQAKLRKIDFASNASDDDTGSPTAYYIRQNKIGFNPIPDKEYDIIYTYLAFGGQMSNDDDQSVIPEEDLMFLVYNTAHILALQGDDNRANEFKKLAERQIYESLQNAIQKEVEDTVYHTGMSRRRKLDPIWYDTNYYEG